MAAPQRHAGLRLKSRHHPKVTAAPPFITLAPGTIARAAELDREADHQLAIGRHWQAERLAHQAAELRGAA